MNWFRVFPNVLWCDRIICLNHFLCQEFQEHYYTTLRITELSPLFKYGKCYFRDENKLFQLSICEGVEENFMAFFF